MNYKNFERIFKTLTKEQQDIVEELVVSLTNMNDSIRQKSDKQKNFSKQTEDK